MDKRPPFEKRKRITYVALIKEAVEIPCKPECSQLRDWSLDAELLLDAQKMYHAATGEAWAHGGKIYAGRYLQSTRSDWLSRHLQKAFHD